MIPGAPSDVPSLWSTICRIGTSIVLGCVVMIVCLNSQSEAEVVLNRVASLILTQPKAKKRAQMFEKFIGVASQLRDLENFDALMGVLAGLSSQPVARLTDTDFELVKAKPIFKKFRSLKKLMANLRGFSAYRMALASSGPQTLPYLYVADSPNSPAF